MKDFRLFALLFVLAVGLTGLLAYVLDIRTAAGVATLAGAVGGLLTVVATVWLRLRRTLETERSDDSTAKNGAAQSPPSRSKALPDDDRGHRCTNREEAAERT